MEQPTAATPNLDILSTGNLIDGKKIADDIFVELEKKIQKIKTLGVDPVSDDPGLLPTPGLAVIIVGERKDSQTYVRMKRRACDKVGISSFEYKLAESAEQTEVEKLIIQLNQNNKVHGILVQLPLPSHMSTDQVLGLIKVEKDVDGFHPINVGRLCMKGFIPPLFVPCTPKGCIELLERYNVALSGKNAVVLGRSNIVGIPAAFLLLHKHNCTVTICHSKTQNIEEIVGGADIVVAAIGKPHFVKGSWIKKGAVVIDVGINAVDDPNDKRGYKLVGDVDFEEARKRASLITPVPGGVGPMTIAMLLSNTVDSAAKEFGVNLAD